jgi:long-chain acyl-CoA synthetase
MRATVERRRGEAAFYVRDGGVWSGLTWEWLDERVHRFAAALDAAGLTPGRSVCILMGTVPEWPIADLGTIAAGGVSVGLYPTSSAEQCAYIVAHSDAEFVVVDTAAQLAKLLAVRAELPMLKKIIALDEQAARETEGVVGLAEFLECGGAGLDVAPRAARARPDDVAIMVYTSGTTGPPKGACLSHRYVLESVASLRASVPLDASDVSFSYLPYCHVAERISGFYNRLAAGAPAYFVDDLGRLPEAMREVRPTVFASLPRFFEKIRARILADVEADAADTRAAFDAALTLGRSASRLRQTGEPVPDDLRLELDRVVVPVAERVGAYFGGRLRLATSGGAPLPLEVAEFFDAFGIPILQAYGLTESLCVAFNRPDRYRFGTVGPAMPGCEVRIAGDGEILVRSRAMFSGYYKEPERTAEVLSDGWLLTGDLGAIDEDGFLRITGRKKEIIVTSTGKNVSPALIENMLKEHFLVSQAMVYGDGKSYLVALETRNAAEPESYARARGIPYGDVAGLARTAEIVDAIGAVVDAANARVSSTEAVKRFVILERDLSVAEGEVTPTMKVRRDVVARRYRELLEGLYR